MEPIVEELAEEESLRLIEEAEIGRIGFSGRYGPIVLPVNYKIVDGAVVFRVAVGSSVGEDLRTGIARGQGATASTSSVSSPPRSPAGASAGPDNV